MQCTAEVRLWDAGVLKFAHPLHKLRQLQGSVQPTGNYRTLDIAYCKDLLCFDIFFSKFWSQMLTAGSWQEHAYGDKTFIPTCSVHHLVIPLNTTEMMITVQFACFPPNIWTASAPGRQKSLAQCHSFWGAGNTPHVAGLELRAVCAAPLWAAISQHTPLLGVTNL